MMDIKDIVKPFGAKGYLVGIGVAALAYFLAPQLKQSLRPAAVKGAQGVMTLGSKTRQILEDSKEKISSLISETTESVRNKMKGAAEDTEFSSKVLKELSEEREMSNRIMNELKDSILSLKEEISHMKRGENFQES